jgi:hypothetical protein
MNFDEFETQISERETVHGVGDIEKIRDLAEQITLDALLHMVNHEILFAEQPKILPLGEERERLRIAILQRPGLRGRYYIEMTDTELKLFRWGYEGSLATYLDQREIKPVYDHLRKNLGI